MRFPRFGPQMKGSLNRALGQVASRWRVIIDRVKGGCALRLAGSMREKNLNRARWLDQADVRARTSVPESNTPFITSNFART